MTDLEGAVERFEDVSSLIARSREVPGFEGKYRVTEDGQVISLARRWRTGRNGVEHEHDAIVMKPGLGAYRKVTLHHNGESRNYKISRLVATCWVEKPDGCDVVNHIDGDKYNDHASNLEWTTARGNTIHARDAGLFSPFIWVGDEIWREYGSIGAYVQARDRDVIARYRAGEQTAKIAASWSIHRSFVLRIIRKHGEPQRDVSAARALRRAAALVNGEGG